MPLAVFVLGLSVFCMSTTEVMVSGLVPALAHELQVSVPAVGNLVSLYAAGMVLGGPVLTVALLRTPRRTALLSLLALFVAGQTTGALAPDYAVLAVSRVVTALAAAAFFGLSAAACAQLVGPAARGRALSIVFGGMMLAQVVGLPAATVVEQHFGWRASFWIVDLLTALCAFAVLAFVPRGARSGSESGAVDVRAELAALRNRQLWVAYLTNALVIGSVFAAFSYFSPIFTQVTGFSAGTVPALFALYGAGTIAGNWVVGRLADRRALTVLTAGLSVLAGTFGLFAWWADNAVVTVAAISVLGLVGMPMNPAMTTRVMRIANDGPIVNSVNTATINVGIGVGPLIAGLGISAGGGFRAPLWIAGLLAVAGLLSVLPYVRGGERRGSEPSWGVSESARESGSAAFSGPRRSS